MEDTLELLIEEESCQENYEIYYRQDKKINELEKENLSLRQQGIEDRKAFEREKEEILSKQSDILAQLEQMNIFKIRLGELLSMDGENTELLLAKIAQMKEQLDQRDLNQPVSAAIQPKNHANQQSESEDKANELQKLAEAEIASKSDEIAKLTKKINKQTKRIETLRSLLGAHMTVTKTATVEASLEAVRSLQRKSKRYKRIIKRQVMEDLQKTKPIPGIDELKDIISQQGTIIESVVKSIHEVTQQLTKNVPVQKLCKSLEQSSRDLDIKLEKLNESLHSHSPAPEEEKGPLHSAYVSEDEHDESATDMLALPVDQASRGSSSSSFNDLNECMWINRTREILSLERQLLTANRKLAAVDKSARNQMQLEMARFNLMREGNTYI